MNRVSGLMYTCKRELFVFHLCFPFSFTYLPETMNYEITAIRKREKINGSEFTFCFLLAPLCSFAFACFSPACLLLREAKKKEAKKIISRLGQYLSFA